MKPSRSEFPICMNAEAVNSILSGRKVQTRVILKHQPPEDYHLFRVLAGKWAEFENSGEPLAKLSVGNPYGEIGSRLWVRETWALSSLLDDMQIKLIKGGKNTDPCLWYKSDNGNNGKHPIALGLLTRGKWRPPIHMQRWATRIILEVTGVRVERVQSISETDAYAEGVGAWHVSSPSLAQYEKEGGSYRNGFHKAWNKLNAKNGYSWDKNPWVWVYEFKRIENERTIDNYDRGIS